MQSTNRIPRLLTWVTLFLILFIYIIEQTHAIRENHVPGGDGPAFLETSLQIHENGGLVQLLPQMFSGEYTESNRHPMYVALISPLAERDLSFFENAKVLTFVLSLTYLVLLFLIFIKFTPVPVALFVLYLYATSYFFQDQTAKISTEPLFLITVLLGWYAVVTRFEEPVTKAWKEGAVIAIAYLTKVTGFFLLIAYAVTEATWYLKHHIQRVAAKGTLKPLLIRLFVFVFGFTLLALPLLWRNTVVYQNPLHNYNSQLLWIESGGDRRSLDLYVGESQSISEFLDAQTPAELGHRVISGLTGEAVVITQLLLFDYGRIRGAVLIAVLFGIGLWLDPSRKRALFSFFLTLGFYIFFSWYYRISGHFRYIMPVLFLFYFYTLPWMYRFAKKWLLKVAPSEESFLITLHFGLLFLAATTLWSSYEDHGIRSVFHSRPSGVYEEVEQWVESTVEPGDRFINGPGHQFQVEWLTDTAEQSVEMPLVTSFEQLTEFTDAFDIRYIIVASTMIRGREEALGEYFSYDLARGMIEKSRPPGWLLRAMDRDPEPEYFIYEIT